MAERRTGGTVQKKAEKQGYGESWSEQTTTIRLEKLVRSIESAGCLEKNPNLFVLTVSAAVAASWFCTLQILPPRPSQCALW